MCCRDISIRAEDIERQWVYATYVLELKVNRISSRSLVCTRVGWERRRRWWKVRHFRPLQQNQHSFIPLDPYQKAISWTPHHSIPSKFTRHILFSSNRVSGNGYSQGAAFLWSPGVQQAGHELEFLYPTSPISHPFFDISLILDSWDEAEGHCQASFRKATRWSSLLFHHSSVT